MKVEKRVIAAYTIMMRALASEARLSIISSLNIKPKTWDELKSELRVNPKSLRDHLAYLRKSGLVKRRKPHGFELTEAGKAFVELSLNDIMETAKRAAEIARAREQNVKGENDRNSDDSKEGHS